MELSIIIPCYNEEKTLKEIIEKVLTVNWDFDPEIIIVDDSSKDSSLEIAHGISRKHPNITVLHNSKNLGKTQSVVKGIKASTGKYVVIQDADLEYDPQDLLKMYKKATSKKADVIYGNRFGKKNKIGYLQNYVGNKGLSFLSNIFTFPRIKKVIPDMEVCYKMIRGSIARDLAPKIVSESSFGFEPEITSRLSKYRKKDNKILDFYVVPISYFPRSLDEGKHMKAFSDGLKALIEILRFNIFTQKSLQKFKSIVFDPRSLLISVWIILTISKLTNVINFRDFMDTYKYIIIDSYDWIANGVNVFENKFISFRNPALPLIIKLLWHFNLMSLLPVINHIFLVAMIYYIVRIMDKLEIKKYIQIYPLSIIIFNNYINNYANYIMADLLAVTVITISFYYLLQKKWKLSCLILGISSLFQNFGLLLLPVWMIYYVVETKQLHLRRILTVKFVKKAAVLTVIALLPNIPWFIYKLFIWGDPLYTKVKQFELLTLHFDTVLYYIVAFSSIFSIFSTLILLSGTIKNIAQKKIREVYIFIISIIYVLFFWVLLYNWATRRFLFYLIPFLIPLIGYYINQINLSHVIPTIGYKTKTKTKLWKFRGAFLLLFPLLLYPIYFYSHLFRGWDRFPLTNQDSIIFEVEWGIEPEPSGKVSLQGPIEFSWNGISSFQEIKPFYFMYDDRREYYKETSNGYSRYKELLKERIEDDKILICPREDKIKLSNLDHVLQITKNRSLDSYKIVSNCEKEEPERTN
jgi:glycosyltransferase involved in cell wall biosynthesis